MHHLGNDADDELAALIDAALHLGADGRRVMALVRDHGWRPAGQAEADVELIEGLLSNGTHVPVRIIHASRRRVGA